MALQFLKKSRQLNILKCIAAEGRNTPGELISVFRCSAQRERVSAENASVA